MHLILFGIILGLGAAIPIGPINLEMIRRNLRFGTPYGISLGLGACLTDFTYLVLLCLGALTLLNHPAILQLIGFVGSMILAWFGIKALKSHPKEHEHHLKKPSLIRYILEGYVITFVNPFTILFWLSVSSQISLVAIRYANAIYYAGAGVIIGTVGWVLFLNTVMHFTSHKLSTRAIRILNNTGGLILLSFACIGFVHALGFSIF